MDEDQTYGGSDGDDTPLQPPTKPFAATLDGWAQYNLADSKYNAQLAVAGDPGAGGDEQVSQQPVAPTSTLTGNNARSQKSSQDIYDMADGSGYVSAGPDKGSHQCVALVKAAIPELGPTSTWRQGAAVAGPDDPNLQPGTAIAKGWVNGRYLRARPEGC